MLKLVKYILVSIYVICGGLFIFFALPGTGYKALSVATGSMTPAIPQGSLVVIHKVAPQSLKVGDVVTYINPANTKQTITHRIVALRYQDNLPGFVVKGDANLLPDKPILGGNVVGQVQWSAPYLGSILDRAKQPIGLALLVIIPGILIIIDELRRLVRALVDEGTQKRQAIIGSAKHSSIRHAELVSVSTSEPGPGIKSGVTTKKRSMDGLKHLVVIGIVIILGVHSTLALITSTATLANNTIATATRSNHIVISEVFLGSSGGATCPTFSETTVTIFNTGPGSNNQVVVNNNCNVQITNNNVITIINQNTQSSSSGSVTQSGNVSGGSSSTGNVSNNNNSSTAITIGNGTPSVTSTQWFELHNPTTAAVTLVGWKVSDNSGANNIIPTLTLPAHSSVIVPAAVIAGGVIGNGLTNAGDRLILRNTANVTVDALSWGSDTTILNLPAIPNNGSAKRLNADYDTDTATDWVVQGP